MSVVLVLWLMCGFLADLPTAFSRTQSPPTALPTTPPTPDEPKIRKNDGEPVSRRLTQGNNVTFHCEVESGHPKPEITWYFGWTDKQIKVDPVYDARFSHPTDETWRITGIKTQDKGKYRCIASNEAGEDSLRFEITDVDVPPTIDPLTDIIANAGDQVTLECVAAGSPNPTVEWYCHGSYYTGQRDQFPRGGKSVRQISFSNVNLVNTGEYTCRAKNGALDSKGDVIKVETTIKLFVRSSGTQSPPTAPPTASPTAVTGCGYVQNNQLTSPGYPGYYPHNMDCFYNIYIPKGKRLKIDFQYFGISDCWNDYVKITNDQGQTFGTFCGNKTGEVVYATADKYAFATFHSDGIVNGPGYKLVFSRVSQANFTTSAPWPPYTTYQPFTTPSKPFPSYYPSMGPKCKLQTYIHILEIVLNEMNNVVEYELGSKFSAREYKVRVKRALSNVQAAKNYRAGRQKRDVREVRKIKELENRAAELMKKLDAKEAQSKMRALLNRKLAEIRAENAPKEAY